MTPKPTVHSSTITQMRVANTHMVGKIAILCSMSLYLGNDTRSGHDYYGKLIQNRIRSIQGDIASDLE